jgi:hypothetical protein
MPSSTLFNGSYSYRKLSVLAWGFAFCAGGSVILCHAVWVIWLCARDGLRGQLGPAGILVLCVVVLMLGAGGGMIWAGVRMTKAFARAVTINILIDSEGVSIGDTTYPWECIAWIGGRRFYPFSEAVSLCFVRRGNRECGYHVPLGGQREDKRRAKGEGKGDGRTGVVLFNSQRETRDGAI